MRGKLPILTLALLASYFMSLAASPGVPVAVQYPLYCKALSFDRNLTSRCGKEIVIAVLYQKRFRVSLDAKEEAVLTAEQAGIDSIKSLPMNVIAIDLENPNWRQEALDRQADILMLTPVRALEISEITEFSRSHGTLTMTLDPELVQEGIAIGISTKDNRPRFKMNLSAARAEGADFSSQLLNLADLTE